MSMKKFRPTTAGRRNMTGINYRKELSGDKPLKSMTRGKRSRAGRSHSGRTSVRFKGGGVKRKLRDIDFTYIKRDIPARVETVEYDPNRSGFIARLVYADGERRYMLAPKNLKVGAKVIASEDAKVATGNRLPLSKMPVGTFIYNIEMQPGTGARIARSAGNYAEVQAHDGGYTQIKLPSTEVRRIISTAWATVGAVSNEEHSLVNLGTAGRARRLGQRPKVRGSVMNPVDHPYGGGEGRQGRGLRRAKSKWGKPTGIGQKTRKPKKQSGKFIVSRRKVGKRR